MNRAKWMGTGAFAAVLLSVAAEARAGSILRFADLTDTVIVTESTDGGTTFIVRISNGEGYPDARAFTWTQTNALAAAATANGVFLYVINEQAGTDQTNQVSDGVLFRTTAGSQDLSVTFYSFDGSLPPALGGLTPYNDGQNGHPGPGIDADSFQVVPYPLGVNAGFRLEYQSDVGAPEPAPEPATVTLFTFGLFVVVLYRFGRLKSAPVAGASGSTWCWFAGSRGCTTRSRC